MSPNGGMIPVARQRRTQTGIALYGFVVVVGVAIAASLASSAGVCFANARLLNDKDFFRGAASVVIHDPVDGVTEAVPSGTISRLVHSQKYASADAFLRENPDCCRFAPSPYGDGGPDVTILDKLMGVRNVEVTYAKRYVIEGEKRASKVIGHVAVTSCGRGRPFR